MFTGIVTSIGRVRDLRRGNSDLRLEVETDIDLQDLKIGASILLSGCCFTVIDKGDGWYAVEVSNETLHCSTLGAWSRGFALNQERPQRLSDELGGHMVTGHVDGVGEVESVIPDGGSHRLRVVAPAPLHRLIAKKGSITIDGVSLTVTDVADNAFEVCLIPHTWASTTLRDLAPGARVNLEIDILARYLARWEETQDGTAAERVIS